MPKTFDPFDLVIGVRDRLLKDGVDDVLPTRSGGGGRRAPAADAFDRVRRAFYERQERPRSVGEALVDEVLPPRLDPAARSSDMPSQGVPGEEATEAETLPFLRGLQEMLLRHPQAAREVFGALVAEGRRALETEEGRRQADALRDSDLMHQARLVLQMTSLSLLEGADRPNLLPSAYLDGFFRAAASSDPDALLDRLFDGGGDE